MSLMQVGLPLLFRIENTAAADVLLLFLFLLPPTPTVPLLARAHSHRGNLKTSESYFESTTSLHCKQRKRALWQNRSA
jgi:hypothetical protein